MLQATALVTTTTVAAIAIANVRSLGCLETVCTVAA